MHIRTPALVLAAALLTPLPARAQIYAWRDVHGTLVLSDRKLSNGAVTYAVPDAPAIRATTPLEGSAYRDTIEPLVQEHALRHALRPDLVRAVIQVESGFNPRARSPRGAMGLMQLMPQTAAELGVRNAYDPEENIRGGCTYLRKLMDRYDGNEELALAAYNAGAEAVDRHGKTVPPYRETRDYVKRVAARGGDIRTALAAHAVYKSFEIVNGRAIPRYSSQKPATGTFETIVK